MTSGKEVSDGAGQRQALGMCSALKVGTEGRASVGVAHPEVSFMDAGVPVSSLGFLVVVLTGFHHVFQKVWNSILGCPVNEPGRNLATRVIKVVHENSAPLLAIALDRQALLVLLHSDYPRLLRKLRYRDILGQDHVDLPPVHIQVSPLAGVDIISVGQRKRVLHFPVRHHLSIKRLLIEFFHVLVPFFPVV